MVERRDRGDGALQRLAPGGDLAGLSMRRKIAGEDLAVVDQGLVGGEQQHIRGPADFVLRVLEAQARLERDQARESLAPRGDEGARLHENLVAVMARERRAKTA